VGIGAIWGTKKNLKGRQKRIIMKTHINDFMYIINNNDKTIYQKDSRNDEQLNKYYKLITKWMEDTEEAMKIIEKYKDDKGVLEKIKKEKYTLIAVYNVCKTDPKIYYVKDYNINEYKWK
jgi:hypothetical protein